MLHIIAGILVFILKALLFVLLAVLVLVLLLCLSRLGVRVRLKEDGSLEWIARLGIFQLSVTRFAAWREAHRKQKPPALIKYTENFGLFGEMPEESQAQKKKKTNRSAHKKAVDKKPKEKAKPDVLALIGQITDFLSEAYDRLSGDGVIRVRRLVLVAAAPEAADTAALFGHMNTAAASLLHVSSQFKRLDTKKARIGVYSDFSAQVPRADADIELNFSFLVLARVAWSALQTYLAVKKHI